MLLLGLARAQMNRDMYFPSPHNVVCSCIECLCGRPHTSLPVSVRDWSLITGRGGGYKTGGGGGHVKFYPYKKGGGRKKF